MYVGVRVDVAGGFTKLWDAVPCALKRTICFSLAQGYRAPGLYQRVYNTTRRRPDKCQAHSDTPSPTPYSLQVAIMRAFNCLVAALSLLVSASYYTAAATPASPMSPSLDVACDPDARGRHLQELQEAAIADYAHLLYELEDPRAAFDRYIPG